MEAINNYDPFSSTIAAVEAAKSKYELIKDDKTLGKTFHKAGLGLSLISRVLSTVRDQILADFREIASAPLGSCEDSAKKLQEILFEVSEAPADARRQFYVVYIEKIGRTNLVEILVMEMMELVCQIVTDCVVEEDKRDQLVTALRSAIDKLASMEPTVPAKQKGDIHFANHGPGSQFNVTGGFQQNAAGYGRLFAEVTFAGGVTFN